MILPARLAPAGLPALALLGPVILRSLLWPLISRLLGMGAPFIMVVFLGAALGCAGGMAGHWAGERLGVLWPLPPRAARSSAVLSRLAPMISFLSWVPYVGSAGMLALGMAQVPRMRAWAFSAVGWLAYVLVWAYPFHFLGSGRF